MNTAFHSASHYGKSEEAITQFAAINRYHVGLVPYLLEKLKAQKDGESHLLHNSLVIYGSPMSDANIHHHSRCPLFIAGHAGGAIRGGLHVKAADDTPMANAMLSMLQALGHDGLQAFGNSTRALDLNDSQDGSPIA